MGLIQKEEHIWEMPGQFKSKLFVECRFYNIFIIPSSILTSTRKDTVCGVSQTHLKREPLLVSVERSRFPVTQQRLCRGELLGMVGDSARHTEFSVPAVVSRQQRYIQERKARGSGSVPDFPLQSSSSGSVPGKRKDPAQVSGP